jgi:hypothetical protein
MKTYTKEDRSAFYRSLREQWKRASETVDLQDPLLLELYAEAARAGLENISQASFAFVFAQMKEQGLTGIPYVDCKTFEGWKRSGFHVRRGEQSRLKGLTWLRAETKNAADAPSAEAERIYPKVYHLFHRSQVEEIA